MANIEKIKVQAMLTRLTLTCISTLVLLSTNVIASGPHPITANGTSFNPNDIKKSKLSDSDEKAPHGQGGYFFFNSGFGIQLSTSPNTDQEDSDAPSSHKFSAVGSLGLGYTHRFANNVVFGGELEFGFPLWRPKTLIGYMLSDNDQISIGLGYNFMPWILLNSKSTRNLSAISGLGGDLAFQHFFTNGMFLRANLQAEYTPLTTFIRPLQMEPRICLKLNPCKPSYWPCLWSTVVISSFVWTYSGNQLLSFLAF